MKLYILENGTQYAIKLHNDGKLRIRAALHVDGKEVGDFVMEPISFMKLYAGTSPERCPSMFVLLVSQNRIQSSDPNRQRL